MLMYWARNSFVHWKHVHLDVWGHYSKLDRECSTVSNQNSSEYNLAASVHLCANLIFYCWVQHQAKYENMLGVMKKKLMECFTDTRQRHLTTVCKLVILFYAWVSGAWKYVHYHRVCCWCWRCCHYTTAAQTYRHYCLCYLETLTWT